MNKKKYYNFVLMNKGYGKTYHEMLQLINNLQQENEELKEYLFKSANNTNMIMELYEDYKSRCEKAIEYLQYAAPFRYQDLLNILQNGSDNNE